MKQIAPPRIRRSVQRFARERLGIEVRRARKAPAPPAAVRLTKSSVLFEADEQFQSIYAEAVRRSRGEGANSAPRLYNLVQALAYTGGVDGLVAECGVYRGLSAYVLCRYLQIEDPSFTGEGFHVFDSFEGLSEPSTPDRVDDPTIPVAGVPRQAGLFRGSLDEVRATLGDFPAVTYHQGWIPGVFEGADPGPYRLVHVDVDLHDPTRDSLAWAHPRLAAGGLVVCDDYGFIRWPGARTAVDEFCEARGLRPLALSTAQAMIFGPGRA